MSKIKFKNFNYDSAASLLIIALGLATVFASNQYRIGSLASMGPGYFPLILGLALLLVGLLMAANRQSFKPVTVANTKSQLGQKPYRCVACILTGVLVFVFSVDYIGFAVAAFLLVFISALGDRNNSWRSAFVLALLIAAATTFVFAYVLNMQFDIFYSA